ncbi:MAG TPA: nuclear transport factor 2 family protein [Roseiflexaceae bacterium]|nr:nuclear transport factor 2 family protein [Roseiflexaceae bacterium]
MRQSPPGDPTDQVTLQIIHQFHAAFNRHAVDEIMALMTEDCVFENTYPPPDGARLEGADAVRAYWHELFQQSPNADFAVEEVFACGERAVLRWRYSWLASDGSAGHIRGVDIFRVRAGKVAEKLSYVKG